MDYDKMTHDELVALALKLEMELDTVKKVLAKRPPSQILAGAGGIASEEKIGKM